MKGRIERPFLILGALIKSPKSLFQGFHNPLDTITMARCPPRRQRRGLDRLRALLEEPRDGLPAGENSCPCSHNLQFAGGGPTSQSGLAHGNELQHVEDGNQVFVTEINHALQLGPTRQTSDSPCSGSIAVGLVRVCLEHSGRRSGLQHGPHGAVSKLGRQERGTAPCSIRCPWSLRTPCLTTPCRTAPYRTIPCKRDHWAIGHRITWAPH